MTATTTISLTELNASPRISTLHGLTLRHRIAIGRTGASRLGTSGAKMHLLAIEEVVADSEAGTYANRIKVGQKFSIVGFCNNNGQRNGREIVNADTDAVTCSKCLARLEWIAQNRKAGVA
jgi:hypothetical protein